MKKFIMLILALAFIPLMGCQGIPDTSDEINTKKQNVLLEEAVRQTGMPNIHNFAERKLMKSILELRDDPKILNYAYTFSQGLGRFIYIGRCYGYPIPYSTQYTAPERPAQAFETHEAGNITVPQADPNGLFSPGSADGTWLAIPDPKTGDPRVAYFEEKIEVFPFKIEEFSK